MNLKLIFLGTPEIACNFLRILYENGFKPSAVITQPDRKAGRGLDIVCPPVKKDACELKIPVFQPSNNEELFKVVKDLSPDLAIVVAYGVILKKSVLEIPKYGFINVHFSLLPLYRGADPVRRAILNGEKQTGITIFKIDEGMDSGPILLQEKIDIGEYENSISVLNRLVELGSNSLIKAVEMIISGKAVYTPQIGKPSFAPKIKVEETFLDFSKSNLEVFNKIRAFSFDPYSRAFFDAKGKKILIQIISGFPKVLNSNNIEPGSLSGFEKGKGIFIKCFQGDIFIEKIKPAGGKILNAYDYFINGYKIKIGEKVFNNGK